MYGMDKKIFSNNLIKLLEKQGIDATNKEYLIVPIFEEGKKYSSKDDFVRLLVFPPDKIANKEFCFEDIVQRYSVFEPLYPMWIDVYQKDEKTIVLYSSMRFRRPSEIIHGHGEDGYKPFRYIEDNAQYL